MQHNMMVKGSKPDPTKEAYASFSQDESENQPIGPPSGYSTNVIA